jgi:putative membrane protein
VIAVRWDDYGGHWGWGDWVAMSLMMLVLWGLLAVAVVLVLRWVRNGPADQGRGEHPGTHPAEQVLAERYARGEIDEDEYLKRLTVLRGSDRPVPTRP